MKLVNTDKMKAYPGGYFTGTVDDFIEQGVLRIIRMRRRQLGQMTMALDVETAKRRIPDGTYQISRKIDGEFTVLIYRDGEACIMNPGGTVRAGAPFMAEAAAALQDAGVKSALIGGELYVRKKDGSRPRVHDVVRVARNPVDADEVGQLCMGCFNIYDLDGVDLSMDYDTALAKMRGLFGKTDKVHPVETVSGDGSAAVLKQFNKWVLEEGEEGVVARSPTAGVYKIKPRHSLDLAVIGFTESLDDRAGMLHDLLLAVVRPSGNFQLISRVGGGFSDEQRGTILKQVQQRVVESDFREVNSDRVAYQMVSPGLVIEIECLDLISRTSRGNTIDKMVLEWNEEGSRWEGVRRLPLCSVLSPQFIRFRDDKKATPDDIRLSQITDIVDIPDINRVAEEEVLPNAEILKRLVATKTLKGGLMVRKILAIQTNKQDASKDHPAFVLHVTDFSPNRKSQLQFDLKVTSSRDQLTTLFEHAKKEYIKKGWEEVS